MVECFVGAVQVGVRGEAGTAGLVEALQPVHACTHRGAQQHRYWLPYLRFLCQQYYLRGRHGAVEGLGVCGLSKLLGICERYVLDQSYNAKKSECMIFRARGRSCSDSVPPTRLNSVKLKKS